MREHVDRSSELSGARSIQNGSALTQTMKIVHCSYLKIAQRDP